MRSGYTTPEAALVSGLSERQVRGLASPKGPVVPTLRVPSGRGSVARYDTFDLFKLACLAQLAKIHGGEVRGTWVAQAAQALDGLRAEPLSEQVLVLDEEGAYPTPMNQILDHLTTVPSATFLRLDAVNQRLKAAIARRLGLPAAAAAL